jgi:hypothetical protein
MFLNKHDFSFWPTVCRCAPVKPVAEGIAEQNRLQRQAVHHDRVPGPRARRRRGGTRRRRAQTGLTRKGYRGRIQKV